ncbi:putative Peroxisomal membrane protein [Heracleum sosnowskyi]|uniref:Peroxisomal membrane protein n=1 Tax=Heracleum sosnowskyi TaxID=360622 RepID=A0AAD8IPM7_9APIA|nr:putative Peroxisomal membrane protein [Heracleum sosnowskyi]
MAIKGTTVVAFLVIFNVLVSFSIGRDIPKDSKNVDVKKPETFNQEGSVLIPGIGRVMIPPKKKKCFFKGVNPFTYNPVTGTNTGHGISIPTLPNTGLPGYVPGNDDTFVPNPGFEVPTGFPAPPIRN